MHRPRRSLFFKGVDLAGMALTLYAAVGIVAWKVGLDGLFADLRVVISVYVLGQVLQAAATARREIQRPAPLAVLRLSVYLSILSLWDLIAVVLILPIVALAIVTGPLMSVVFILSTVLLALYGLESVLGDIEGVRSLQSSAQAVGALAASLASGGILWWRYVRHCDDDEPVLVKGGALVHGIRESVREAAKRSLRRS